jgi:phosphatidate cytidylyltransferase
MTELQKRLAVSAVFIPLILAALYLGGPFLIVFFALVVVLASSEFIAMLRHVSVKIPWYWIAVALATYSAAVLLKNSFLAVAWAVFLITLLEAVFRWDRQVSVTRAAFELFGVFYTAILPAMSVKLDTGHPGGRYLLLLVVLIWITDSAAYFVGMKWGRRRNLFAMSPNKSLEGFIAGAVAPFIIVIILFFTGLFKDLAVLLLAAFAAGLAGQFGDLVESMLKRFCEVKDSSHLIPGHGGILDRSDSILLAGSFLYCAMMILDKVR